MNLRDKWLKSNAKQPEQVRWACFPLGVVQRWIERAEEAEEKLAGAAGALGTTKGPLNPEGSHHGID